MTRKYPQIPRFPSVMALSFLLTGCLSTPSVPPVPSTIVKVVAQRLPERGTRVIVWDVAHPRRDASEAAQAAIFELLGKEMIVTERAEIERLLHIQKFSLTHGAEDTILRVGRLMNAQQIVFVRQEDGHVHLRGVDAESGRILWTGEGWTVTPRYSRYGYMRHDRWADEGAKIIHAILAELWKQDEQIPTQTAGGPDPSMSARR
ncbi:MAG: hypothetical protein AB7G48_09845 [Nitrospiraceae bacterium]